MELEKAEGKQSQETKQSRWGFRGKTVWDWLQLLMVPVALALFGYWFSWEQEARQQEIEAQRAQDLALEGHLDQ